MNTYQCDTWYYWLPTLLAQFTTNNHNVKWSTKIFSDIEISNKTYILICTVYLYEWELKIKNLQKRILYFKTTGNSTRCVYFNSVCYIYIMGNGAFWSDMEIVCFVKIYGISAFCHIFKNQTPIYYEK